MASRTKTGSMMIAAAAVGALMSMGTSGQASVYWSAASDGGYETAANWTDNGNNTHYVPGSQGGGSVDAYIRNGHVVTLDDDFANNPTNYSNIRYFNINSGGAFDVPGQSTAGSGLIVTANGKLTVGQSGPEFRVGGAATVTLNGGSIITGQTKVGGGTLGDATVTINSGTFESPSNLFVTGGTTGTGYIELKGGQLTTGGNGATAIGASMNGQSFNAPTAGPGIVNQTGGSFVNGRQLYISNGTYNLSGGSVNVGSGHHTYAFQLGIQGTGTFNLSGSGALTAKTLQIGVGTGGNGLLAVSGGTLATSGDIIVGNSAGTGVGVFRITGNTGNITTTVTVGNNTNQSGTTGPLRLHDNGTLNFQIGPTGVSEIVLNVGTDVYNAIALTGTLDLDAINGYVPQLGDHFDLISTNNNFSGTNVNRPGLTFTNGFDITQLNLADTGEWSVGIVQDNGKNILRVTSLVPEPSTVSLLAVGGLALLRRRRRRRGG